MSYIELIVAPPADALDLGACGAQQRRGLTEAILCEVARAVERREARIWAANRRLMA